MRSLGDAGARGGRVREDARDGGLAADVLDLHADAGIAPVGVLREGRELLGRVERGVGIVELRDEAARRLLVEGRGVDGVDEARRDLPQHLIEEHRAVARLARLPDRPAGDERDGDEGGRESGAVRALHGLSCEDLVGPGGRPDQRSTGCAVRKFLPAPPAGNDAAAGGRSPAPAQLQRYAIDQARPSWVSSAARTMPAATSISLAGLTTRRMWLG